MKYGKGIFVALLVIASLALLASGASGTEKDAAAGINDVICLFIRLIWMVTAALAAIVIIFAGLRYLLSGDDASARSSSKQLIMGAFVGIIIIFIAVPVVNYAVSGFVDSFQCDPVSGTSSTVQKEPEERLKIMSSGGEGASDKQQPDLVITDVRFKSLNSAATAEIEMEIDVKNQGGKELPYSSRFTTLVILESSGGGLTDTDLLCAILHEGALEPDETTTLKCDYDLQRLGLVLAHKKARFKVHVDALEEIAESEAGEKNNVKIVDITAESIEPLDISKVQIADADENLADSGSGCGGKCGGFLGFGSASCTLAQVCRDGSCQFSEEDCCGKKCGEATCPDDKGSLQTCGTAQRCVANDAGTGCVCASPRTGEELRDCCYGRCGVVNCGDDVCVFKSSTPYTSYCYCEKSSDFKCNYISETDTSCLDSGCGGRCPGARNNVEKTVDGIAVCNKNSACRPTSSGYDCLERASTIDCFEDIAAPSDIVPVNPLNP